MRIRRSRHLASCDPANAASSSAPPPPEPWLHAATEDCDICQRTPGADPQVAPEGIKHKGQIRIASPEQEAGLEPGRGWAESQVAPEGIKHKGVAPVLASSAPADAAPSSAAPPPEPWLNPADEDFSFCQLTRGSDPQVAPDGIKHKGQTRSGSPDPQAESDDDDLATKDAAVPEVTSGGAAQQRSCFAPGAAASLGCTKEDPIILDEDGGRAAARPVTTKEAAITLDTSQDPIILAEVGGGAAARLGTTKEAAITLDDESSDEMEESGGGATLPVNGSATEPEVTTGGATLASGTVAEPQGIQGGDPLAAEPQVLEVVSLATGLVAATPQVTIGSSLGDEAVAEQQVSEGVPLVSEALAEAATVSGVTAGALLDSKGAREPDVQMEDSSVNEEMDVTHPVTETATHPEKVSPTKKAATERDVPEGVPPASEAATKPADVVTVLEVTTGVPVGDKGVGDKDVDSYEMESGGATLLVNGSATEPEVTGGISLASGTVAEPQGIQGDPLAAEPQVLEVISLATGLFATTPQVIVGVPLGDEAVAEQQVSEGVPLASEASTEAATVSGVTTGAPLDNKGTREPESDSLAVEPSLLNESTELEITGVVSIAKEAAAEPEVIGEAFACSEDGGSVLNEPQPLVCDLDCATVQYENAGPSVANEMLPSRDDAADEIGSASSTSTGPVRDKSQAADEKAIKARSVGKSGRSDIICYARRRGKRKLDMAEMNTEHVEMGHGDICDQREEKATLDRTAPCESAMPTAGSAEIKLADIKKGLADNSVSSKAKRRKGRYVCDIDYCRMAFKEKSELSVHKKNTCTVKSCGKHFRCHTYLKRHQTSHNEDTPYKCPWEDCSMAFKWRCSLADHFLVHTGEKPYRCKSPGCSKIYKCVSDLIRHKKRCKPQRSGSTSSPGCAQHADHLSAATRFRVGGVRPRPSLSQRPLL